MLHKETEYKIDDHMRCFYADGWDRFLAEVQARDRELVVYRHKIYLEKRLSKAVGQKIYTKNYTKLSLLSAKLWARKRLFYN